MEWNTEPVTAQATSTSMTSSGTMDAMMTMSDGSVMSMPPGMAMSGMPGMSGTGAAMDGMDMTGPASKIEAMGGAWGMGMGLVCLGAGAGFLAGML